MPSRAELAAYVVYVGFDAIGDATEKKARREEAGARNAK